MDLQAVEPDRLHSFIPLLLVTTARHYLYSEVVNRNWLGVLFLTLLVAQAESLGPIQDQ